ncbi:MAG: NADH-quinone oxidoreductase subunit L [Candidatus Omnitrophota bacterium]|nr:NADH-quinone oxidoreductase subunit L [Candidatus Omnitrophota bacterium]
MVNYAHLIPIFPFLAFTVNILFGRKLKKLSALISILASACAFLFSLLTLLGYLNGRGSYTFLNWFQWKGFSLDFGVLIDPLSCTMLLVVTFVGTLIQIYSIGYMHDDPRFSRFFAYISLFTASMLGLVLADNLLLLFIFWEGVGVCSYLLISFWFERESAANAGMKAFITTRIGDIGLLIGILILFSATHTFNFSALQGASGNYTLFTIAAFLIFSGAVGKSAQFPLHVWLPDAMEGPTPVSALIHAATMVAAGVYLVGRTFWLFSSHPLALNWVAYIGAITALFAASIATVNNDIKRILAYSTISQLGFMMMGLGMGGYSAGIFHLVTHAFFKALLFLCAGSVIHAVHTQDIQKMGGLFSKLKVTGATFIIASLAIAGIPPFAGFWSKDEILSEALRAGHPVLFSIGIVTSLLTAFYMFRLIFLVLLGKARSKLSAHESPRVMTIPLSILALCAITIGLIGSPFMHYAFQNFIHPEVESLKPDYLVMLVSTLVALLGIGIAYSFYILNNKILPVALRAKFAPFYRVVYNKYYVDEIYDAVFIKPCIALAKLSSKFDSGIIDGAVNGTARVTVLVSRVKSWFDLRIIDGVVNLTAKIVNVFSRSLRLAQTGRVQSYLLVGFLGLVIIILIKFMGGI